MERIGRSLGVWVQTSLMLWLLSLTATAQFITPPSVTDSRGIDSTFSTDRASLEPSAIITFQTTGAPGDYRVIIDTNGPGGKIEGPDGQFNPEDDWVKVGMLGSATGEVETVVVEWDGRDKNGKVVKDGTYRIRVEIDYNPNGMIDATTAFAEETEVTVDSRKPIISLSSEPFSPNDDGSSDTATISYVLSEDVQELKVELVDPILPVPPSITISSTTGNEEHLTIWNGKDGMGKRLEDGTYTLKFIAVDAGGNVGEATLPILIDTRMPKLVSVNPSDGSMIRSPISEVAVQLVDEGEAGIDYEKNPPVLTLIAPDGSSVDGRLERNEESNRLIFKPNLPLSLPTQNGRYTVKVEASDKAGNKLSQETNFIFDSQPPKIISATSSGKTLIPGSANAILPQDGAVTFTLEDQGGSGIDFASVNVNISGPSQPTSLSFSTDGVSTVNVTYAGLSKGGTYTLEITFADRAGNTTSAKYPFRYSFDALLSDSMTISPEDGSYVNSLDSVRIQIADPISEWIDPRSSTIKLLEVSTSKEVQGTIRVEGNTLVWHPSTSFRTNGQDDGLYRIEIGIADKFGSVYTFTSNLTYDTQPPRVEVTPKDGSVISSLENISIKLSDDLSGYDALETNVAVIKPDGTPLAFSKEDTGEGLKLKIQPLAQDGSDDGIYTLRVTPKDKAGNASIERIYRFAYVAAPEEGVEIAPEEGTYVSDIKTVEIRPIGGWIDLQRSEIKVIGPDGEEISGKLEINDKLVWRIDTPRLRDGSQDGEYKVRVNLVDKLGNSHPVESSFNYDSLPPKVISISPQEGQVVSGDVEVMVETSDKPGEGIPFSGVDLLSSTLKLIGPNGKEIGGSASTDGISKLTFKPYQLVQSGRYRIELSLRDKAGNVSPILIYYFEYQLPKAALISSVPEDGSYVRELSEIRLSFNKETDLAETARRVSMSGPKGSVAVKTDFEGGDLVVRLEEDLAIDGSDDGVYRLNVTPVDRYGNEGTEKEILINYDTQPPELESVTYIQDLLADEEWTVNEEINRIDIRARDPVSGIDFDKSGLQLIRLSDGKTISGKLGDDGENRLWLILAEPLKSDGSEDGRYKISLKLADKAGNELDKEYTLLYDTQPPIVKEVSPLPGSSVRGAIDTISVKLEDSGAGVDLVGSDVKLLGPHGYLKVNKSSDGISTIYLSFNKLQTDGSDDGTYQIEVKPFDKAGNSLTAPLIYEFYYVTQKPEVVETVPSKYAYVNRLSSVSATLRDYSGKGIDLDSSSIRLIAPDGSEVAGRIEREKPNRISLLLKNPLPRDGSVDGQYVIEITVVDKAGNNNTERIPFLFDTFIPVVKVENFKHEYKLPPTEFVLKLSDDNPNAIIPSEPDENIPIKGSGVDLDGTDVKLIGPKGQIPLDVKHNALDTIIATTSQIFQEGSYRLEVTPKDMAGNLPGSPLVFRFSLVYAPPTVKSASIEIGLTPHGMNYTNRFESVQVTLTGSEIDSLMSKIEVYGPNGKVLGEQEVIEEGKEYATLRWKPKLPLTTDGSADGTYTIKVTPADKLGRIGETVEFKVVYDTQPPKVNSISHLDLNLPINYVSAQIERIEVSVSDEGPAGLSPITFTDASLRVIGPNGKTIPGEVTSDGRSKLFWTPKEELASDGSMDGIYNISLKVVDKAGNSLEASYPMIYDTIAPSVEFVEPKGELVIGELTKVVVRFNDPEPGRIDFDSSYVKLIDPKGHEVSAEVNNNGVDTVTLTFSSPEEEGTYTIMAMAVDKAGNGAGMVRRREFNYSTGLPVVISTTPKTSPPEEAYTNQQITKVEAKLKETNNGGISFLSQIRLRDPNGNIVPGSQSDNGVDTIIWNLAKPLATDGSEDGLYTITVIPINASGRRGDQLNFTFFYDTVPPEVDLDTLEFITSKTVRNSLSEIQVSIKDDQPGSGINWDEVDENWFKLIGPDGKPVSGKVTSDKVEKLIFKLDFPLATDGSQDGRYQIIISPEDKAGNKTDPVEYDFVYDTKPPVIDPSSLKINGKPLVIDPNSPDYPTSVNSQTGVTIVAKMVDEGVGVDLTRSTIQVFGPDGNPISGTIKQNGVDTLEFSSDLLPREGIYKVMVKAVGLDVEELGISPTASISTSFLFELGKPVAKLTEHGPRSFYKNEPAPLKGIASDPSSDNVPASGVALVEVGGYGPDGEEIEWIPAEDESGEEEEPWSKWSLDFLPAKSGKYELKIRVTDNAGNWEIYDGAELEFSVSLGFRGDVYAWPNPISRSRDDIAHFSFDVNLPSGETAQVTLTIYDVSGDLVYQSQTYTVKRGRDYDEVVTWDCRNQFGDKVATGIYIFRIEAYDGKNRANKTGRILVVR